MKTQKNGVFIVSIMSFILAMGIANAANAQQPVPPIFQGLSISCVVQYDGATSTYTYSYSVANPASNTLNIWGVEVDLRNSFPDPQLNAPPGWTADIAPFRGNAPRHADWGAGDDAIPQTIPGSTITGLTLLSQTLPSMREATIEPWIDDYMDALYQYRQSQGQELLDDEIWQIEGSYKRLLSTLGPLGVSPGSFEHWDTFISDVGKAGQLGWISDAGLLSGIQSNLAAARQAAVAQDAATTNAKLQAVIDAISASTPSQRTSEGYALVYYNAKYLQQNIPWPCEPKLTAIPASATHPVGETHTVTATLVNVATALPIANNALIFDVTDGPNLGLNFQTQTDANGKAAFSYIGTTIGTDTIIVHTPYGTIKQGSATAASQTKAAVSKASKGAARAAHSDCTAWDTTAGAVHATWEGGPDLTVPLFVPPTLISSPGNTFYITEKTRNIGNLPSGPSVTRYYIATSKPLDPSTAIVVGQRSVPALAPGETSEVNLAPFTVPASLPSGTYYLDACADADNQVVETNEANNCASSSVQLVTAIMPQDRPPDCSKAAASPAVLWPPNHKLQDLAITGVTDPDGDPVTLVVTAITQDEPLNALGDGDTCPDGFGVGTPQAQVRAERSGLGNGRVYKIAFTANDGKGGSCTGTVAVGVPHDKKDTPVDDGQMYDSTKCP
jgi:hypothetical protein